MVEHLLSEQPVAVEIKVSLTAYLYPEPDAGGYSAEIPALPGCYTQGDSVEEVHENLREAAEAWLADSHDQAVTLVRQGAA